MNLVSIMQIEFQGVSSDFQLVLSGTLVSSLRLKIHLEAFFETFVKNSSELVE